MRGTRAVTIDLRAVEFFDLSGLRLLFGACETWPAKVRLVHTSPQIDELLEFSGFATLLTDEQGSD